MDLELHPNPLRCGHFHTSDPDQASTCKATNANSSHPTASYPNNTLLADLVEQHQNIAHFWCQYRYWHLIRGRGVRSGQQACTKLDDAVQRRQPAQCYRSRFNFAMPEPLMRANVKLKLEDYDKALSVLTNDIRYQLHLLLYTRVQSIWLLVSSLVCILMPILLANFEAILMFTVGSAWLISQLVGALLTAKLKDKLNLMLEKSVAQANSFFVDHNLLLGIIHSGGILSKAKLSIPILYFDTSQCREQIESYISTDSRKEPAEGNQILDYSKIDSPSTKPNSIAIAQSLAMKIILRYSQRWISYFDKQKLIFSDDQTSPRHLSTGKCLCQFIEEHFQGNKHDGSRLTTSNNKSGSRKSQRQQQLVIGDHRSKQLSEIHEQVAEPKLTKVLYAVKDKPIPSLSYMVSMKDQIRIDMKGAEDGRIGPDVSLDMSGELISRSDDLVKKLRLLLELRKDELQGIDGSLFSGLLYRSCLMADQFRSSPDPKSHESNNSSTSSSRSSKSCSSRSSSSSCSDGDRDDDRESELDKGGTGREDDVNGIGGKLAVAPDNQSAKRNLAEKLFYKRDRLFFLTAKRNRQEALVTANKSNMLEIC